MLREDELRGPRTASLSPANLRGSGAGGRVGVSWQVNSVVKLDFVLERSIVMGDLTFWAAFLLAAIIINISPGPELVFVITRTITHGRKHGFYSSLGIHGPCHYGRFWTGANPFQIFGGI